MNDLGLASAPAMTAEEFIRAELTGGFVRGKEQFYHKFGVHGSGVATPQKDLPPDILAQIENIEKRLNAEA